MQSMSYTLSIAIIKQIKYGVNITLFSLCKTNINHTQ